MKTEGLDWLENDGFEDVSRQFRRSWYFQGKMHWRNPRSQISETRRLGPSVLETVIFQPIEHVFSQN